MASIFDINFLLAEETTKNSALTLIVSGAKIKPGAGLLNSVDEPPQLSFSRGVELKRLSP
jgi:hypothetical protein